MRKLEELKPHTKALFTETHKLNPNISKVLPSGCAGWAVPNSTGNH